MKTYEPSPDFVARVMRNIYAHEASCREKAVPTQRPKPTPAIAMVLSGT